MCKKQVFIFLFIISAAALFSQNAGHIEPVIPHVSPSLRFAENKGQWDPKIQFRSVFDGGNLYLEKDRLTFHFYDKLKARQFHLKKMEPGQFYDDRVKCHAFYLLFEGCNTNPAIEKMQQDAFYENFFIGSDKSKWQGDVHSFHQVWYRNLYNGIDYEIITSTNGYKYNFHVKPGADAADIKLKYQGVDNVKLKDGILTIKPEVNEIVEHRPYAYQMINGKVVEVPCKFVLKNHTVSYDFPAGYNKNYELVIDPLLVFAAQSGSTADNFGMTATFDSQGNLYSGGIVFDVGYPTTPGAYNANFNGPGYSGNSDVFISKYNSTGNSMLYSTYMGGGYSETVHSLIVDKSNNLCFYGVTSSSNFPTTANAYDNSFNGGSFIMFASNGMRFVNGTDIYIAKLSSGGNSLLASTFLGGSGNDGLSQSDSYDAISVPATPPAVGNIIIYQPKYDSLISNYGDQCRGEIQVDVANNIYITSSTRSTNFPTVNSFDSSLGGKQDGIVAKFNSGLSSLLYSSFIGGSSTDAGYGIVVKNNLEVYVTGGTCSNDFPASIGAYKTVYQGGKADGYVMRISPAGNTVMNCTYFGTGAYDQSFFVQLDTKEDVFIYGQSLGTMTVVADPNEPGIFSVPGKHQFISRLAANLSTVSLLTVFGNYANTWDISPSAFSVDKCDHIYISGWGASLLNGNLALANMPLASPTQNTTDGNDFYFMALDKNATSLLYGSYFGGNLSDEHVDGGTSRFDPQGKIYQSVCAGCWGNDDFPVTPGAWPNTPGDPNHSSLCNNGVIKLDFQLPLSVSTINTNTLSGCLPLTVSFTNATPGSSYKWYFGNGQTSTVALNPVVTYTNPGTYTVSLVVFTPTTCNVKDSSVTYITVLPIPTSAFNTSVTLCTNTASFTNLSSGTLSANPYSWNLGDGSPTQTATTPSPHTYTANGTYTITLLTTAANGCTSSATRTVSAFNFTPGVTSSTICYGSLTNITANGGTSYSWTPGTGLSNTTIASPIGNPTTSTIYTVQIDNNTPGYTCSKTLTAQILVQPKPTASFAYTANPCGGGVHFFDGSVANIATWQWTLSPLITTTVQSPYNFYYNGGTNTITLIVTNIYGCKDTMQEVINVKVPPPVSINGNSLVCLGNKIQLSAMGGTSYVWSPPQTIESPNNCCSFATPTANTQYSVNIYAANGCAFLLTTNTGVSYPSTLPVAAIATPSFATVGETITLIYTGSPGATVAWLPVGSTTPAIGYTVTASPVKPTTYTAVANSGVCSERAPVYVEAYTEGCIEKDVFVPNTFTPNGDGQNDILFVRGLKVDQVYFAVYNRWGEMVFETTDKTKGWDGIYKGRPADVGVFGWYLKVKCINGEETFKKGNVTLIR